MFLKRAHAHAHAHKGITGIFTDGINYQSHGMARRVMYITHVTAMWRHGTPRLFIVRAGPVTRQVMNRKFPENFRGKGKNFHEHMAAARRFRVLA